MPALRAGTRAMRVYEFLRARVVSGELAVGERLPPHPALAVEFGVSPVTVRLALARLVEDGLVSSKPGRGTVVEEYHAPGVLVVEDDARTALLLVEHVSRSGLRAIHAPSPAEALVLLATDRGLQLVLTDIRMPTPEAGVAFIKAVRRRWPDLPLAAVTAFPGDLAALQGQPEWPVLVIPKPFHGRQIHEALRLAFPSRAAREAQESAPTG